MGIKQYIRPDEDTNVTFHPIAAEYIVSRIDNTLSHKKSPKKFKKVEIKSSIFSDHIGIKQEINCNSKVGKSQIGGD